MSVNGTRWEQTQYADGKIDGLAGRRPLRSNCHYQRGFRRGVVRRSKTHPREVLRHAVSMLKTAIIHEDIAIKCASEQRERLAALVAALSRVRGVRWAVAGNIKLKDNQPYIVRLPGTPVRDPVVAIWSGCWVNAQTRSYLTFPGRKRYDPKALEVLR